MPQTASMEAIFGREAELAAGRALLADAGRGFAVLVLAGEAGIGKSALMREITRRAPAAGFRVLRCHPAEAEAKLALSAVADLLRDAFAELTSLPAPQARALEIALLRVDPHGEAVDPRLLATAVRSAFVELASSRPLLIAIDDVQWLDPASADILDFVLRRLEHERIGVLASHRDGTPLRLDLERAVPPEALRQVRIGPLSVAAIHHLLKARLGQPPSRATLVRLHKATAGSPLFALEIGRRLADLGPLPAGEPLPVPVRVEELARDRITALPTRTREILLAAAALGDPSVDALRAAVGHPVDADLEPAAIAGIATLVQSRVRFEHPLFAAAVYASAPASERRRLHRRLADVVAHPEERARHLALAATSRDEAVATAVHHAARTVAQRGAPAAAVDLVELALALGDGAPEAEAARIYDLADYLARSGENVRAQAVLRDADLDRWPPRLHGDALELLLELQYWLHGPGERLDALGRDLLSRDLPTSVRAQVHAGLSVRSEHDLLQAADHAAAALALLESLGEAADPLVYATALTFEIRNRVVLGDGLDRADLDRVLALEGRIPPDRRPGILPSDSFGQWLKYVDDLDGARRLLEDGLRNTIAAGEEKGILNKLQHLAITECWAGHLELAREYAARACEIYALEQAHVLGYAPAILAIVQAHLGEAEAVRATAERYRTSGGDEPIHLAVALGLLELSLGDDRAALAHYLRALDAMATAGHRAPGIHRVHANAAEAAVGVGDLERADSLLSDLEAHGKRTGQPSSIATVARVRALLAAARGDLPAAVAAAEAALAAHEVLPMPFERARTLFVKGIVERRTRQRTRAKATLEEALTEFQRMGARLWAERTAKELDRVGLRRRSGEELTDSERRVAELAASGLTNREVASAMFISPKTVEANLARAYRKLGIRSRAELGARMSEPLTP
jgi:DNA-binding CsgD family transcriptional regulator